MEAQLKARGIEAIVVLIHEGGYPTGDYNECPAISGAIVGDPRTFEMSVSVDVHRVAEPSPGVAQRLATVLLSAAHGVIALPLGTPTVKLPDIRGNGRLVIGNLVDALIMKLEAARKTDSWPKVTISLFF